MNNPWHKMMLKNTNLELFIIIWTLEKQVIVSVENLASAISELRISNFEQKDLKTDGILNSLNFLLTIINLMLRNICKFFILINLFRVYTCWFAGLAGVGLQI